MIHTEREIVTTLWDIKCAIQKIDPVMFGDITEDHVLTIMQNSLGRKIKIDKEYYGTAMFLNEVILLLYNAKQKDIPEDMNIWLESWRSAIYPLFTHYVEERAGRFIFVRVKK